MKIIQILLLLCSLFTMVSAHKYEYDLLIIGAGHAGVAAALYAHANSTKKIGIISQQDLFKNQKHYNDIAMRTFIHITNNVKLIKNASTYGINIPCDIAVNYQSTFQHIDNICEKFQKFIIDKLKKTNVNVIVGTAHFVNNHTVAVNNKTITAKHFIIATGSVPKIPIIQGIKNTPYLTPESFFAEKKIPKSIIIIGGGSLGTELAFALNRLGVKVTLLMKHGLLLPTFDYELAQNITAKMNSEGISIHCGVATVSTAKKKNGRISVDCVDWNNQQAIFTAEALFIATNRTANTSQLKLENTDVQTHNNGIICNNYMQTNASNIYACGDVVGSYLSVRAAYYESKVATHNILNRNSVEVNHKNFTQVLYTSPSYATVGFTEQDAYIQYEQNIKIHYREYSRLAKAYTENNLDGIAKIVCDSKDNILGVHILGARAEELIGFIELGKKYSDLYLHNLQQMHPYPSYIDLFWDFETPICYQKSWSSSLARLVKNSKNYLQNIFSITSNPKKSPIN